MGTVLGTEVICAAILEILGNIYVAILVGNVLEILEYVNRTSEKQKARQQGIQALIVQFSLPRHIRRQLRKWVVRLMLQEQPGQGLGVVRHGESWKCACVRLHPSSCLGGELW